MSETKKIAITGTIGSGKTMVSEYLISKGYDVFNCDLENAKLLLPNNAGYLKVKEVFPDCFINDELDKAKLAAIVFNDENEKKKLEDIMHPLILAELFKRADDPLFAEVPLLFEVNWDQYFNHNLLVISEEDIIRERLLAKGYLDSEIDERLKNQMAVSEKIKRADKIIYNNGSLSDLYQEIDNWLLEILC